MERGTESTNPLRRVPILARVGSRVAGRSAIRDGLWFCVGLSIVWVYALAFHLAPRPGADLALYQDHVKNWLAGAPMYPPYELAGPFGIIDGSLLYPPITIALFLPSLLLPAPLWWFIPLAITGAVVINLQPGGRWLIAMAACLLFRPTVWLVVAGNPDMWLMAALALAVYWRPAAAFVLLKPSVFPFALIGLRSRGWWVIAGVFALASLVLLPQTLDWLAVIRNSRGGMRDAGPLYSLPDLPLLAVPLLAWVGSVRASPLRRAREHGDAERERSPQDPLLRQGDAEA